MQGAAAAVGGRRMSELDFGNATAEANITEDGVGQEKENPILLTVAVMLFGFTAVNVCLLYLVN